MDRPSTKYKLNLAVRLKDKAIDYWEFEQLVVTF